MRPEGIIFDFDGVLLESEYASNRHLAGLLTDLGYPTDVDFALSHFTGLSGSDFLDAVGRHVGGPLPEAFHEARRAEDERALLQGLDPVVGAVAFIRALPPELPKAIASSSTTRWITRHLDHLGLLESFGEHIYSGHEHVERGKPAPDVYIHAARQIGVPIERCAIIEDSEIGATGALLSGACVIGLVAGSHCSPGHDQRLRALGVKEIAYTFDDVGKLLALG